MFKLKNDIEKLRAVLITKLQVDDLIVNLGEFCKSSNEDKIIMENFKKMFQFGLEQFYKFADLLPTSREVYTKLYFVAQALKGPFREFALQLVEEDRPLWKKAPDVMGTNGNINRSQLSAPIFEIQEVAPSEDEKDDSQELPVNMNIYSRTKLPKFMRDNIEGITHISGVMCYYSLYGTILVDNTLPCLEKRAKERGDESTLNQWVPPQGLYMASDVSRWNATKIAKGSIEASVAAFNKPLDQELYEFRKFYNPYKDNESEVERYEVKRKVEYEHYKLNEELPDEIDDVSLKSKIRETDMYGNTYDKDKAKSWSFQALKEETGTENLKQYTVRGRLGDTDEPKTDNQPYYDKSKPSPA